MRTKVKGVDAQEKSQLNERVVEEIRVWMTRRSMSQDVLAHTMGVAQVWISRRLGKSRNVILTLEEVERFARALDVSQEVLLRPSTPDPRWDGGVQQHGVSAGSRIVSAAKSRLRDITSAASATPVTLAA